VPKHQEEGDKDVKVARLRVSALAFTRLFQFSGLAVFLHEALVRSEARLSVLSICVLCMAGGQVSETVLMHAIDKFLGR
jgi:hypothetical protein